MKDKHEAWTHGLKEAMMDKTTFNGEDLNKKVSTYTKADCRIDTKKHIEQVGYFLLKFQEEILHRMKYHDASKLEEPELSVFVEYTPKLRDSTYGSDEYKEFLKGMQVALDHHYANNSHHPEHYENGIRGMNLIDIVEMFCDWTAATLRHEDGNIYDSIEINQKRFGYSDDLKDIFINTAEYLAIGEETDD